jgi:hypothetical protein
MCKAADRSSIPRSTVAVVHAAGALALSIALLLLAAVTVPARLLRRFTGRWARQDSGGRVDIQVLLDDPRCVAQLRRAIARGLACAASTWSPLPLPVHRVVVGAGAAFPPAGRVDVYQGFPGRGGTADLVVVTLGVRREQHDLEPAEILGALATQIQAVIAERYTRRSLITGHPVESPRPAAGSASPPLSTDAAAPAEPAVAPASKGARQAPGEVAAQAAIEDEGDSEPTVFSAAPRLAPATNGQTH